MDLYKLSMFSFKLIYYKAGVAHRECVPRSVDVGGRDDSCTLTPQKVARVSLFTRDPAF